MKTVSFIETTGSGEILRQGYCSEHLVSAQALTPTSFSFSLKGDSLTQYIPDINAPIITNKPINTTTIDKTTLLADGMDMITLSSIPANSMVLIKGGGSTLSQPVIGTTETITFDLPGTYTVCVQGFPYLDYEVTITAT